MKVDLQTNLTELYFSHRLLNALEGISNFPITVIEGPAGYGKFTAVKKYLSNSDFEKVFWIDLKKERLPNLQEELFSIFSKTITNPDILPSSFENLPDYFDSFIYILENAIFDKKTIFILYSFENISYDSIENFFKKIIEIENVNFSLILITTALSTNKLHENNYRNKFYLIGPTTFLLYAKDIKAYFNLCGIKLSDMEANQLFNTTQGWIYALNLQMISCIQNELFEPEFAITKILESKLLTPPFQLNKNLYYFLLQFDYFNFNHIIYFSNKTLSEINFLVNSNPFFIFSAETNSYFFSPMLKKILHKKFNEKSIEYKIEILSSVAKYYEYVSNLFQSIFYYHKIHNYSKIFSILRNNNSISVLIEHKSFFISFFAEIRAAGYSSIEDLIFVASILAFFSEINLFNCYMTNIEQLLKTCSYPPKRYDPLQGEFFFLLSLSKLNNLEDALKLIEKALLLTKRHLTNINPTYIAKNVFPSMIHIFHTKCGSLDNTLILVKKYVNSYYHFDNYIPCYSDAILGCEIAYFRGEFERADELSANLFLKGIESKNEYLIMMTEFLSSKVCLINNCLFPPLNKNSNLLEPDNDYFLQYLHDVFISKIKLLQGNTDIAKWLTSFDSITKVNFNNSIIYPYLINCQYLLLKKEYTKILKIGKLCISTAKVLNFIIPQICFYIYMSNAAYRLNDTTTAIALMTDAANLAFPDLLYTPFLETEDSLIILNKIKKKKYSMHIKAILEIRDKYYVTNTLGLTSREYEIASLVSKRFRNKEIAEILYLSESTIKSYLKIIFSKLEISSRSELFDKI